jgi:hypothetical protein
MVKNCENCKSKCSYETPSFLDGHHVGFITKTSCSNRQSIHWCRQVNNLITCDKWEAQDETR